MIRCGHCQGLHPSVAAVRDCSRGETMVPRSLRTFSEADEREMHRMEAEADRAETIRDEANKAAWKASQESFGSQMRNDDPADLRALLGRVQEMLTTRVIPSGEMRWVEAMRRLISGREARVTEFALRTAIAKLDTWSLIKGAQPEPDKPADHEGLYRLSRDVRCDYETFPKGTMFQVVRNKEATHLYAKMVTFLPPVDGKNVRPRLDYVRGMIFNLRESEILPLEEAEEITRKTGWCVFGHFLTNPKSIARGMGPKCYERYPHLARNTEEAA